MSSTTTTTATPPPDVTQHYPLGALIVTSDLQLASVVSDGLVGCLHALPVECMATLPRGEYLSEAHAATMRRDRHLTPMHRWEDAYYTLRRLTEKRALTPSMGLRMMVRSASDAAMTLFFASRGGRELFERASASHSGGDEPGVPNDGVSAAAATVASRKRKTSVAVEADDGGTATDTLEVEQSARRATLGVLRETTTSSTSSSSPTSGPSAGADDTESLQLLLDDCVIAPPHGAVLAEFFGDADGAIARGELSAPMFAPPAFDRMHGKMHASVFDRYFAVARRRRIYWTGCPLEVQPSPAATPTQQWRVEDARRVWTRLRELLTGHLTRELAECLVRLVFVRRSVKSHNVVLHFKSERVARALVDAVTKLHPSMVADFICMGRAGDAAESPLAPLRLDVRGDVDTLETAAAAEAAGRPRALPINDDDDDDDYTRVTTTSPPPTAAAESSCDPRTDWYFTPPYADTFMPFRDV
jgi:hypothetical protein